jgi:creatinine amidohydrolase
MPWGVRRGNGKMREETAMRFHDMTFPELRQVPRDSSLVLAAIAACEQHSQHLPTFTDTILVTGVADGVEQRLPGKVLQLPTLWLGASAHHLRFGATLSAEVDTHVAMLCDLLRPLLDDGYQRVLLLNGHGGNIDTMQLALRRLQPSYRTIQLTAASYWDLAADELAALADGPRKNMGHACEFETSMVMALRPELVRKDLIKNDPPPSEPALRGLYINEDMRQRTHHGAVGYPELASPEKGRRFLKAAIDRTVEVVEALLERALPA